MIHFYLRRMARTGEMMACSGLIPASLSADRYQSRVSRAAAPPTPRVYQSANTPTGMISWAQIPLRLIVGYGFVAHGLAKLEKGPENFVNIVQALGTPSPHIMAWLTILVELLGGLAVLLGAFVALASIPMAVVLLVAIFTVHIQFGFTSIKLMAVTVAGPKFGPPGVETDLLYIACLAALVLGGSGPFAVDGWIANRSR